MSASTASQMPPISPAEMQVLVTRAGLSLNPGQMADLVLAWRQVAGLLTLIPRDRPMADDQAFVFRLPGPPGSAASPQAVPTPSKAKTAPASPAGAKSTKPTSTRANPAKAKPARAKTAPPKSKPRKAAAKQPARKAGPKAVRKGSAREAARRSR
jgi:hypothetical protein